MPVKFGDFVLDRGTRQLLRDGQEHRIGPKAFDLLELLLSQRPNVVPKERIRDRLWPDTFVSGSTLATLVAELRSALDEDPKRPQFLRTVHGVGYAFCGEAQESGPARSAGPGVRAPAAYRLGLQDHEVALRGGEKLLGGGGARGGSRGPPTIFLRGGGPPSSGKSALRLAMAMPEPAKPPATKSRRDSSTSRLPTYSLPRSPAPRSPRAARTRPRSASVVNGFSSGRAPDSRTPLCTMMSSV